MRPSSALPPVPDAPARSLRPGIGALPESWASRRATRTSMRPQPAAARAPGQAHASSARPEEEEAVRPHVAAELEHDLRVALERNRAHVAPPRNTADVRADGTAESREPRPRQRLAPQAEQIADGCAGPARDLDHPRRRGCPELVRAARANDVRSLAPQRRGHPDAGGKKQHTPVREQLYVRGETRRRRLGAAKAADGRAVE